MNYIVKMIKSILNKLLSFNSSLKMQMISVLVGVSIVPMIVVGFIRP